MTDLFWFTVILQKIYEAWIWTAFQIKPPYKDVGSEPIYTPAFYMEYKKTAKSMHSSSV